MDNVNRMVANNLKHERWSRNWSQSFVCNQIGISIRTLSRAETGIPISKNIMKKLCALYQIPLAGLYSSEAKGIREQETPADLIPESVAVSLLIKNSFIEDLQREVLFRHNDRIRKGGVMLRTEVEDILPEVISKKQSYSLSDVISCCMAVNQRTVTNIVNMSLA